MEKKSALVLASSVNPVSTSSANKVFGVRIDEKMVKKLKIMAIEENTSAYKLLEEALTMLFASRKHSK